MRMNLKSFLASLVVVALSFTTPAFAQQPFTTTTSQSVPGGALYVTTIAPPPNTGVPTAIAQTFVPGSASPQTRYLALTAVKTDTGIPVTATATGGAVGVSRTAGTSLQLAGEATSSNAKTDKGLWEFNLPDTYVAGANIPISVNAVVTGSGTLTGASTTMTVAAYTETNGVEAALTVSAAQQIAATTATTLTFTLTGTNLVAGQHVAIELVMLVTTASGANTGFINSVAFGA